MNKGETAGGLPVVTPGFWLAKGILATIELVKLSRPLRVTKY
ncbi:hypothetical protein [Streptococcus devriesei]|nr:hypothetical protein [Streptococcus devriesei]